MRTGDFSVDENMSVRYDVNNYNCGRKFVKDTLKKQESDFQEELLHNDDAVTQKPSSAGNAKERLYDRIPVTVEQVERFIKIMIAVMIAVIIIGIVRG